MTYRNETETLRARLKKTEDELQRANAKLDRLSAPVGQELVFEKIFDVPFSSAVGLELIALFQDALNDPGHFVSYDNIVAWLTNKEPSVQVRVDDKDGRLRIRVNGFPSNATHRHVAGGIAVGVATAAYTYMFTHIDGVFAPLLALSFPLGVIWAATGAAGLAGRISEFLGGGRAKKKLHRKLQPIFVDLERWAFLNAEEEVHSDDETKAQSTMRARR